MTNVFDALRSDAFSLTSMTNGINILPVTQQSLGREGLFPFEGIDTRTVQIEYRQNVVSLLPFAPMGTLGIGMDDPTRVVRSFAVPFIPHATTIYAQQLIGVRKFGSTDQMESVQERITLEMSRHKANHELTWEYLRASALCGLVRDAQSGATILNYFTEFGLSEDTFTFAFSAAPATIVDPTPEAALQAKCREVKDAVGAALGGPTGTCEVGALIDDTFFNNMMLSPGVRSAWNDQQNFRRQGSDPGDDVFDWGGISWKRYRTAVGSNNFFGGTNVARFYPKGTAAQGIFQQYGAPGPSLEAVGTIGLPMYASQEILPHNAGIQLHTNSSPLFICKRPGCLKKGTST